MTENKLKNLAMFPDIVAVEEGSFLLPKSKILSCSLSHFFTRQVSLPLIRRQEREEWLSPLMMTNSSFGPYLRGCGNLGLPFVCANGWQAGIQRGSWNLAELQFGVCLTLFGEHFVPAEAHSSPGD